jgi:hypothetical protein
MTKKQKTDLMLLVWEHKINAKEKGRAIKKYNGSRIKLINEMVRLDLSSTSPALYFKIANEWL